MPPKEFLYSSVFGDLTKEVQIRFDAASKLNKQLFDQVIFERFMHWDDPTIELDFEELIGKYNITIAAPTIGENAAEPIMGTSGVETLKETLVNHALTLPMLMKTYRKILSLLNSNLIKDEDKKNRLISIMMGDIQTVVNAVYGKLDMIFLGALSNEGKFVFDETTNPEGGVKGSISFNQPGENIASCKTAWTLENIDTVDCFEDIQAILDASQDKVALAKALLSPSRISYMCRTKKMKQLIWGADKSSKPVLLRDINDFMETNNYPVFEPIRRIVRIQKGREAIPYAPWKQDNIVFVPAGELGVVKNAYSDCELKPDEGVSYSKYGRIVTSLWSVGQKEGSKHTEYTKAESQSLPVITEMNGIYTLKTVAQ